MIFYPFASGSSGNCTLLGLKNGDLALIDAGISAKQIEFNFNKLNLDINTLKAIFITHEHTDHIKGAPALSKKLDISIYATEKTWTSLNNNPGFNLVKSYNKHIIYPNEMLVFGNMYIRPFSIPHDSIDPVAYNIFLHKKKITILTDLGVSNNYIKEQCMESNILLIESNYDIQLLKNSRYPIYIKNRILGERGHLSNIQCANFISEIYNKSMEQIYLAHISQDNNSPHIALDTVKQIINRNNIDVNIVAIDKNGELIK